MFNFLFYKIKKRCQFFVLYYSDKMNNEHWQIVTTYHGIWLSHYKYIEFYKSYHIYPTYVTEQNLNPFFDYDNPLISQEDANNYAKLAGWKVKDNGRITGYDKKSVFNNLTIHNLGLL